MALGPALVAALRATTLEKARGAGCYDAVVGRSQQPGLAPHSPGPLRGRA